MTRGRAVARLRTWGADPTGETWTTASSDLAAGTLDGTPVIAKVAGIEEERRGNRLMTWWSAHGGLPVLAGDDDDDAILMRRAGRSLLPLPADAAETVLADVLLGLHALPAPPFELMPLGAWFHDLVDRPQADPLLDRAASIARDLLAEPGPVVALHGDLHHGNVLDLDGGWVAIDPKGLVGHPAFDVANVFCNPAEGPAVDRIEPRLDLFADRLGLERARLADWVVAWCGLSIAWGGEGWHPDACRRVAASLLRLTSRW